MEDYIQKIKLAVEELDQEIKKSINSNEWPVYCGMLGFKPQVQSNKTATDYIIFQIEISHEELVVDQWNVNKLKEYFKHKMNNPKLQPTQQHPHQDKNKINIVKSINLWVSSDRILKKPVYTMFFEIWFLS